MWFSYCDGLAAPATRRSAPWPCYGQNTTEIVHPDEVVAQSFAMLALGDFPARPQVHTPALLDDLAAVISDGARHQPELRCRY